MISMREFFILFQNKQKHEYIRPFRNNQELFYCSTMMIFCLINAHREYLFDHQIRDENFSDHHRSRNHHYSAIGSMGKFGFGMFETF